MKQFTSQVCTTIEQSKRLLDLGLNPETADMVYEYEGTYPYDCYLRILEDGDYISSNIITEDIPAWSLHRLIEMMPTIITQDDYSLILGVNDSCVCYVDDMYAETFKNFEGNLYNCVVKCIEWLIKEGHFNKEYLK